MIKPHLKRLRDGEISQKNQKNEINDKLKKYL